MSGGLTNLTEWPAERGDLNDSVYYFEQGHHNAWNIYLRQPGSSVDRFVGVIFDSELAKFATDALNQWSDDMKLSDEELARRCAEMPSTTRNDDG